MKRLNSPAFLIAALVVFYGGLVLSCASQEKEGSTEKALTGMIKIYGNEPHTWVGIETVPDGNVYAVNPPEKASELRFLQGRLLEFTVTLRDTALHGLAGMATVHSWRIIQ